MKVTCTRYSGGTSGAVFLPSLPVAWHSVVQFLSPILNFPFSYPNVYLYLETSRYTLLGKPVVGNPVKTGQFY